FVFRPTPTTRTYPLSLHDALPISEALVLGAKAGVEPEVIVDALLGGAARCWALEVRAPGVLRRDFAPGFRSRLHHKDLTLALQRSEEHTSELQSRFDLVCRLLLEK